MRTRRIALLLLPAAFALTLSYGCNNQASFSKAEENAIRNKASGGIPPEGLAAIAAKQKQAHELMIEDMKKRGIQPPAGGFPSFGPGGGPSAASAPGPGSSAASH